MLPCLLAWMAMVAWLSNRALKNAIFTSQRSKYSVINRVCPPIKMLCLLKRDKTARSLFIRQDSDIYIKICVYTSRSIYINIMIYIYTSRFVYIHQDPCIYIKIRVYTSRFVYIHQDWHIYIKTRVYTSRSIYIYIH